MSEDPIIKQYPYDMKAEQLQSGLWKLSGHVYGETSDQVVIDLANMISKAEIELERRGKPLLNSAAPTIKEVKKSKPLVTNKGVDIEELGKRLNEIPEPKKK